MVCARHDSYYKITSMPPDRSPRIAFLNMQPWIKDKVVCDIGCREGDSLELMRSFAKVKRVFGVECNDVDIEICKRKGIEVYHGDMRKMDIPDADVYYIWIDKEANVEMYHKLKLRGDVILGGDPSVGETYDLGGEKKRLWYNEGDKERQKGWFEITLLKKIEKGEGDDKSA